MVLTFRKLLEDEDAARVLLPQARCAKVVWSVRKGHSRSDEDGGHAESRAGGDDDLAELAEA